MTAATSDSEITCQLLERVRHGDRAALDELLSEQRPYLRRLVELRFDAQLQSRVDPSDVVQETLLTVAARIEDYLRRQPMPFWLWLRQTACERLVELQRRHVSAARRTVGREVSLPAASSIDSAESLLGQSTPSEQAAAAELADQVRRAVDRLDADDRSIIVLRSYEQLTNQQAAEVLGIESAAASRRFGRALLRLKASFQSESPP
jgi:RNA polymerase sigma-70 factor (ECF subfamily)